MLDHRPVPCTKEVILLPLFHSTRPLTPSTPYRIAGTDCLPRSTAVIVTPAFGWNSPLDMTKTTPLTTIGESGAFKLLTVHPGRNVTEAPASATFSAFTD